jgi:two-component system sensor kinase FixL
MGVGLTFSHSIVEAHYGELWGEPDPGGGAILSFTLPLADFDESPEDDFREGRA